MSTESERKNEPVREKLTIKNKGVRFFQEASIETKLKETAKAILENYCDNPKSLSYDDRFRLHVMPLRKLSECISKAFLELQQTVPFPNRARDMFEKIGKNVHAYLLETVGGKSAKFEQLFKELLNPKSVQKVPEASTKAGMNLGR